MRDSFRRIGILTGRNMKEILRDPLSLIFTIALPLLLEVLFYLIFHKMTAQFEMRYLAPGIVVFSQAFLTLFAGILISQDRNTAFLTRLYVSKARSYEFIFGYVCSLLPIALAQSVLFFLVGGILEPAIFSVGMIWGCLISLVTALFYVGAGILVGSLANEKAVGGMASIVITGQSILSGMWFPVEGLGKGVLTAMKCLPFKNATLLVQNSFLGVTDAASDFWIPLAVVLAYTVAVTLWAIFAFRKKMKGE